MVIGSCTVGITGVGLNCAMTLGKPMTLRPLSIDQELSSNI